MLLRNAMFIHDAFALLSFVMFVMNSHLGWQIQEKNGSSESLSFLQALSWLAIKLRHAGHFTDRALLLCDGDGDVVYRKSPLPEKIFAHVSQSGCRVDCVSSHAIPF